jgi:DNA-binding LacI/PurR family transcriptional regulator
MIQRANSSVTINDIARLTNVSTATVSRALNNRKRVDPEVRQRILMEARRFNYRPKMQASLSTVGLFTYLPISYIAQVDTSIMQIFSEKNWVVETFTQTRAEQLIGRKLNGIIALDGLQELEVLNQIEGVPVIIFNGLSDKKFHAVLSDHVQSGYLAGKRLLDAGHERIAIVCNGKNRGSTNRVEGVEKAFREKGLTFDKKLMFYVEMKPGSEMLDESQFVYYRGLEIINTVDRAVAARPTAIFLADEHVTTIGMPVIQGKHQLRVPQDISVIGFATDLGIHNFYPQLTMIEQPLDNMAKKAYEILDQVTTSNDDIPQMHVFPNRLVEGCSVSPVRRT